MEIYKFKNSKSKLSKKKIVITILIVIVVLFFALYKLCYPFRQFINNIWSITPSINLNVTTIYIENDEINGIIGHDKYLSILNQNKLSTYTTKENIDSEENIKVSNMLVSKAGKYLVIAQKDDTDLYLFNGNNLKYNLNTSGIISQVFVNKNGYVAVSVQKSGYRSTIVLYNPDGQEVFTTYLVNTYANCIRISNNNKYLAFAEIDTTGIQPVSRIKFIQIDKVGTDNYTIDTEKEENTIISKLEFHGNNEIVYLTDTKIKKVNTSAEKTEILDVESKNILNVDISLGSVIVIVEKNTDKLFKSSNDIKLYNLSGELISTYQVEENIKQIKVDSNIIGANVGQAVYFVTSSGRLVNKYETTTDIKDVIIYDNGSMAALIYRNKIELIYI